VAVIDALRGWPNGIAGLVNGACAIAFVVVGWLISERRANNAVGPLLLTFGALFAWYLPADLYLRLPGPLPADAFAAVFVGVLDAPMFILVALVLTVFPDGRVPSRRWRAVVPIGLVGIALAVIGAGLEPGPIEPLPAYRSPFGVAGFPGRAMVYGAYGIMLPLLVVAAFALVTRWRRGNAVQRTQIKWVVAATLVLVIAELVNVLTWSPTNPNAISTIAATVGIALVPIAMGVAILRYRLYAIDRIISRTLAYGVVTGILGFLFIGIILTLQALLAPFTRQQGIAVAASTLAVFALFQPVLRRVRAVVDRRFDRARYDADLTVRTFAARLRGDIDLGTVRTEIIETATSAVRPTRADLWLRETTR
jgi:MFS family permease